MAVITAVMHKLIYLILSCTRHINTSHSLTPAGFLQMHRHAFQIRNLFTLVDGQGEMMRSRGKLKKICSGSRWWKQAGFAAISFALCGVVLKEQCEVASGVPQGYVSGLLSLTSMPSGDYGRPEIARK